jgi:NitT/TauT family transport system substrate-binding protein
LRLDLRVRWLALTAVAAVAVGCTSGGATGTASAPASAAPPASASAGGSAAPSAAAIEPETKEFKVAFGGPGVSTVALLHTIKLLNEDGWKIETPELSAGELQLQGVASGEFQMSSGSGPGVLLTVQQGAPIKVIVTRIKNEWTLYSKSEIADCAALNGVKLAIHSEGSPATFMTRDWIKATCPGTEPEYIILPGSENRYAALIAGEIDASPIELPDAIALEAEGGDKFKRQTSFAETMPDLLLSPVYVNSTWAQANPNTVTLFVKALLEEHKRFNEDPAYFKATVLETLDGVNEETIDEAIAAYVDLGMYDVTGGLTPEQQKFTIDFITTAGGVQPGLTPEQVFDRSYLDRALELLGD